MIARRMSLLALVLSLAYVSAGCSDFLEVSPRTAISPDDLGATEVEQLLNGVYRQFQNGPGMYNSTLFDMLGGNLIYNNPGRPEQRWIENNIDPADGINTGIWRGFYNALYRTNVLLDVLDGIEPNARRTEVRGISHFFRGYGYYELVTRYGGVPILRENTRDLVARDSEAEVWAFVTDELDRAIDLAPSFASRSDYFYVTAEAAKALQARTALARGDMTRAASLAEEVIESGHFSLESNFERIFRGGSNSETIFAFENNASEGTPFASLFLTVGWPSGGSHFLLPAEEVRENRLFSEDDLRKEVSFTYHGNLIMVNKYHTGRTGGDPIIVTRLGEMYLISAEAQGLAGLDRLNELRQARGLDALAIADESAYQEAVAEERRRELIFEGFRWFDLIRTGRAVEELQYVTNENQLRLPIPQAEIDQNPQLEQNPGY